MKTNRLSLLTVALLFLMPLLTLGQTINLGTAANFAAFTANGAVSNTGISHLTGHVGSNNGSSTGFGNVNGVMHDNDGASNQCAIDLLIAYNQLNSTVPTFFPSSLLGNGDTLLAGTYSIAAAATLNGVLILDAKGNPNAKFIFKVNGAFASGANAKVKLINGALACNVFWKIEGLVNLAPGTFMRGSVIANNAAIVLATNDTIEGRLLSTAGAVTLNGVLVYTPVGCGSPYLTGPAAPNLLTTANFAVLSGNGPVTNTGISHIDGSVGTNVGLTTGFNPLFITNGMLHPIPDATTAQAAADLLLVYGYLNTLPYDIELLYPAQFGNDLVLTPHTYLMNGATTFTGDVYLDAQGNADAIFVLKLYGALTTSTYSNVKLINGAQAKNVYWLVEGAVQISDYSVFCGNLVVNNGAIDMLSGAVLNGRAHTTNGAISIAAITSHNPNTATLDPTLAATTSPVKYGTKLKDIPLTITPSPIGFIYKADWLYNNIDSNNYQPLVSETSSTTLFTVRLTRLIGGVGSAADPGYSPKTIPIRISVYKDTILVSGITANNKVYNGTTTVSSFTTTNVKYDGFTSLSSAIVTRNGVLDNLVFNFATLTGSFANANVGIAKPITLNTTTVVSGSSLPNYAIIYNSMAANITKAPAISIKLKAGKPILNPITSPANFAVTPVSTDFDFTGFVGSEESLFAVNFGAEDFRYALTQGGAYKTMISPAPGTYNVVVNKATNTDSLRNGLAITLTNASNIAIAANYDSVKFLTSPRTQTVNAFVSNLLVTWPAASSITYGQTLANVNLTGGSAKNNITSVNVPGTFVWSKPTTTIPANPNVAYVLKFIPTDLVNYAVDSTTLNLTILKAMPLVNWGTFSSINYGQSLSDVIITGQTAANPFTSLVITGGVFSWVNSSIVPNVSNLGFIRRYTPTDLANYQIAESSLLPVTVNKVNPTITQTPNPYVITYGQMLPTITATAINANNNGAVVGTYEWIYSSILFPPVGTTSYLVRFTPTGTDAANYNIVINPFMVTVNKVTNLTITWPAITPITYGQTLADVGFTGTSNAINPVNNAYVPGTFVWSKPLTTTPANPNVAYVLKFIPTDLVNFSVDSTTLNLTILKAVPNVNWGTFSTITYGESLSNITITGQIARNPITSLAIAGGVFSWINPSVVPNVTNAGYIRRYTPTDLANYQIVESSLLPVLVNKANPTITQTPNPYVMTYGQALPAITATAINANNNATVNGTYEWVYTSGYPQTGTASYLVRFTPTGFDAANYNIVINPFMVTVNKASNLTITWPTPTPITYGQTLADVGFTGLSFAINPLNNTYVLGSFVWSKPLTTTPANPNIAYVLKFLPTDLVNYSIDSTIINLTILKALPNVNWGTFSTITYGESLSDIIVTGQVAKNPITTLVIAGGVFSWINPSVVPNVNNSGFIRRYVPTDLANYLIVESGLLPVVVNKANPTITQTPNPYIITYGQVLPLITATAINANNNATVNGTYEWMYTGELYPQAGIVTSYLVRFTPMALDAENYNIVIKPFNVLVNKAKPIVIAPISTPLTYEQALSESQLSGGSAMNPYNNAIIGGTFIWVSPTTIPDAGFNSYPVVFVPQDANNYLNSDPIGVRVKVEKKHIDIVIYNLEHLYNGQEKNAAFRDAENRVDLTGMLDVKYFKNNTSFQLIGSPIEIGAYRVIATILPTENYEGSDSAILLINKNVLDMTNPGDDVEIVNSIIRGMNPYFRIGNYDQLMPITVKMMNSNGNQVYQSQNYMNNFNMTNLPNGTYFYIVKFTVKGTEYTRNGRVEVIGQ